MKDTNGNKNKNTKINYSLELLRFILCFWVVLHHCCRKVTKFKGKFHVPTFMIMSFYFYYNTLKTGHLSRIKQRFQRISTPYIIWPILIFIFNNILLRLFGFSIFKKKLLIKDLLLQLILGTHYHVIFYYLFVLIFLTLLFSIISILFNKNFIFIFQLLLILAYIIQYKYWSLYIKKNYTHSIESVGALFELMPFSVSGITLYHLEIIPKLKQFKELSIFYIVIILYFILKFDIFVRIKGLLYPGVMLNIGGICIFLIFSIFSFKNRKLIFLLNIITKFTGGIYYIHIICFFILSRKVNFISNFTFKGSLVIYIISYIICYFGNKLSFKTKIRLLFN